MFLKREGPETEDFVIQKISGCEGRITSISIFQAIAKKIVFTRHPFNNFLFLFAYSCVSKHSNIFFFFRNKKFHFLCGRGTPPT